MPNVHTQMFKHGIFNKCKCKCFYIIGISSASHQDVVDTRHVKHTKHQSVPEERHNAIVIHWTATSLDAVMATNLLILSKVFPSVTHLLIVLKLGYICSTSTL